MSYGGTIKLTGETEYRKALKEIGSQMRELNSEMKLATAAYEKSDKSVAALSTRNTELAKQLGVQREKVDVLREAYEKAKQETGEDSETTRKWHIELNNAQAKVVSLEREIENNNKTMAEAADNTEDLGKETKNAGDNAEKSTGKFEKLGNVCKELGKAAAASFAAISAGAIALSKEVISSFGELEQNLGGSEAVFGEYAKDVQKLGEEAYRTMGTSQSEYLATANKMGALFQGSGLDQQRSMELTTQAMQRATDMASVMGIETSAALEAVTGAAKGNYTMMDNLGVAMNATTLKSYAAAQGFETAFDQMSNAEKAEVAMQYFFENTTQYANNFEHEATSTISGSLGLLSASWQSFIAGLGNSEADMKNLSANIVDALSAVVDNIVPVIDNIVSVLPEAINDILDTVMSSGVLDKVLTAATDIILTLVNGVIDNLPKIVNTATTIIEKLVSGLISGDSLSKIVQSALSLIEQLVQTILGNLPMILNVALDLIQTLARGLADYLPELIPSAVAAVLQLVDTLTQPTSLMNLIDAALTLITALGQGLIQAIPELLTKIPTIIMNITSAFLRLQPQLIKSGAEMISGLVAGILNSSLKMVDSAIKIFTSFKDTIKGRIADAVTWGRDLMANFISGITSKIQDLKNRVAGVAQTVKNFLGFSEPEEGPLSDFHTYAPDMMDLFASGIRSNVTKIRTALTEGLNIKESIESAAKAAQAQVTYSAQQILRMSVGLMPKDMTADLDKDGKITAADARAALTSAVTAYSATDILKMTVGAIKKDMAADLDNNGIIDAADARLASRRDAGLEDLRTYSFGDVHFTITASDYNSPEELAEAIEEMLTRKVSRKEAAYA